MSLEKANDDEEDENASYCCRCVSLPEGVVIVGVFGSSFHAGQLTVQLIYGHSLTPSAALDPLADVIVRPLLIAVHCFGILVNILLAIGAFRGNRHLLIPWLLFEGIVSAILLSLSLYYLILYPEKGNTQLLWHSVIMVVSFLVLLYYSYVVQELLYKLWTFHLIKNKRPKGELPPTEIS